MRYDRFLAGQYAQKFALGRNDKFYDFSSLGGDCTNFVSQCLYAGVGKMDYTQNGWFYKNLNNRSPSWTGVEELSEYLINNTHNIIKGVLVNFDDVEIGDVIQLKQGQRFNHSLIVTKIDYPILSLNDIFISCHSSDRLNARLSSFVFKEVKFLKVY